MREIMYYIFQTPFPTICFTSWKSFLAIPLLCSSGRQRLRLRCWRPSFSDLWPTPIAMEPARATLHRVRMRWWVSLPNCRSIATSLATTLCSVWESFCLNLKNTMAKVKRKCYVIQLRTRFVSSMINSFTSNLFCLRDFEKWGRTYRHTTYK